MLESTYKVCRIVKSPLTELAVGIGLEEEVEAGMGTGPTGSFALGSVQHSLSERKQAKLAFVYMKHLSASTQAMANGLNILLLFSLVV